MKMPNFCEKCGAGCQDVGCGFKDIADDMTKWMVERLEKMKQGFLDEGYDPKTYARVDIDNLIKEIKGE